MMAVVSPYTGEKAMIQFDQMARPVSPFPKLMPFGKAEKRSLNQRKNLVLSGPFHHHRYFLTVSQIQRKVFERHGGNESPLTA